MKIYIVTAGEYSDYHICEVFLERSEAEKYVAVRVTDDYYHEDEIYIEEHDTYEGNIETDDKVVYVYEFLTYRGNVNTVEPYYILKSKANEFIKKRISDPDEVFFVKLDERDDNKAFKIACDEFAKRKAMKEGIC